MATAEDRFTRMYEQHYEAVRRYVQRRVEAPAVRDVVAEVFLVAWRRFPEVPTEALPWLYGTARRVLANETRGVERRSLLAVRAAERAEPASRDHADDVVDRVSVAAALGRLSAADAEALRLVGWEDLTLRQAARAAGASLPAFTMRLHRARARLRQELAQPPTTRLVPWRGES